MRHIRRRLVESQSLTNVVVGCGQPGNRIRIRAIVFRCQVALLNRQQQLGHHVPVDAAQPLKGKEGAGTTCEGAVVEGRLKEV